MILQIHAYFNNTFSCYAIFNLQGRKNVLSSMTVTGHYTSNPILLLNVIATFIRKNCNINYIYEELRS